MAKSHVSVEQHVCIICGKTVDVGILLHKRLSPVLDQTTVTGYCTCPECKKMSKDGYVALIEADPDSPKTLTEANQLGRVIHLRRSVAVQVFNVPATHFDGDAVLIDSETADILEQWASNS